ncbi:MAG TPA: hypothetical protein VHO70_24460 [Chitinispirillaceae bacterium]|nr:hypothetical protein [Chitinispirillaceae bacterium]
MVHSRKRRITYQTEGGILSQLWNEFWAPPVFKCPKCKCEETEFYDPFFFSPIRAITGRRRIQCKSCRFIWRQSRSDKSIWERLNIR